jgi:hypothetical protein
MSLHLNIITNYTQEDATFLDLVIFTDAVHVSGGSPAHHQEQKLYIHFQILLLAATVKEMELEFGNMYSYLEWNTVREIPYTSLQRRKTTQ